MKLPIEMSSIELLRPWKLVTLAIGLALLIVGARLTPAPDWDIPISIIIAVVAYVTAPWCMRVLLDRQWRWWPVMVFLTWFGVNGCYALYWYAVDPNALALMRDANAPASLSLFGMCGLLWLHRGDVASMSAARRSLRRRTN